MCVAINYAYSLCEPLEITGVLFIKAFSFNEYIILWFGKGKCSQLHSLMKRAMNRNQMMSVIG